MRARRALVAARLSLKIEGGTERRICVSEGNRVWEGEREGWQKDFLLAAASNAACSCLILMAAFIVNLLGSDAAAIAARERAPRRRSRCTGALDKTWSRVARNLG